jgi:protein-disulfide isomerase
MSNAKPPSGAPMSRKERRAAERAGRKNSPSSSPTSSGGRGSSGVLIISAAAIAIGVIVVLALIALTGGFNDNRTSTAIAAPDTAAPAEALRQGRTLVAPDAVDPVDIQAFEDPQCPHCGNFTKNIEPLLVAGPISDGTASFTYNDFVIFGAESRDAAIAMRVAEDMGGKFWDYQHALYFNQKGENDGSFSRSRLADIAVLVGLDRAEFLQRMDDPAYAQAVDADKARGVALGVTSTPTLFVNGKMMAGVPAWQDLKAAIEEAAQASPAPSAAAADISPAPSVSGTPTEGATATATASAAPTEAVTPNETALPSSSPAAG